METEKEELRPALSWKDALLKINSLQTQLTAEQKLCDELATCLDSAIYGIKLSNESKKLWTATIESVLNSYHEAREDK